MNNLQVISNDLIPVYEDEQQERMVNARELHSFLEVRTPFHKWVNRRIEEYGFEVNADFWTVLSESTGGRPATEYLLSLDTAKEIAMVENNERGRQVRRYFIEVEKKVRQSLQQPKTQAEMLLYYAQQLVEQEKRMQEIEDKAITAHHRIDNLDSLDTIGDLKQRLNAMVRKYATVNGISYQKAWRNFRQAFNIAYKANIKSRMENYKVSHGLKQLTMPQYLEKAGLLDDAIRVADKMLNRVKGEDGQ